MERIPQPVCQFCNINQPLTVKHVLIDCIHFAVTRQNYFNVSNMKDLFDKVRADNILGFLKETALYQKL